MQRDTYFDSLKGLLIIFVVLGHTINALTPFLKEPNQLWITLSNFIHTFHMPLFIFVSGYFSKTTDSQKIKKQVITIFETLLVIQLFRQIIPAFFRAKSILGLGHAILIPGWALWYLMSLIIWKIATPTLSKYFSKKTLIIISIIAALLVGFLPFPFTDAVFYPYSRTIVFFPFFLLGVYVDSSTIKKIRNYPKGISAILLIGTFIILYLFSNANLIDYLSGAKTYFTINGNNLLNCLTRGVLLIVSAAICILVTNLAPDNKILSVIGKDSLTYYIFHITILLVVQKIVFKFLDISPNIGVVIAITILIIILLYVFSKMKLSKFMLNPITTYRTKVNKGL